MSCIDKSGGQLVPGDASFNYTNSWNVGSPTYNTATYGFTSAYEGWKVEGDCIANFHARQRRGDLLPYTRYRNFSVSSGKRSGSADYTRTKLSDGSWARTVFDNYFNFHPSCRWYLTYEDLPIDLLDASYDVQKAAAAIYSKGHDTLTFIAELHKVRGMLSNTVYKILNRRLLTKNIHKSISQLWLEWRYGWRTLIYDLQDLNEAVTTFDDQRKRYTERRGYGYYHSRSDAIDFTTGTNGLISIHDEWADNIRISARGVVSADITPSKFSGNPARTAWELVPWSFVVDWFVNIGQAIEAASFLTFASKYVAAEGFEVVIDREFNRTSSMNSDATYSYSGNISAQATCSATWKVRNPSSVSYTPLSRYRLDESKIHDLISIIKTRLIT